MISPMHHSVYSRYVSSKRRFDLYMRVLLAIRVRMDTKMKTSVPMNMSDCPRPNHAVSENGMYMFRNTMAKSTENVTVPISWYLPNRYSGSFLFIFVTKVRFLHQSTKIHIFV